MGREDGQLEEVTWDVRNIQDGECTADNGAEHQNVADHAAVQFQSRRCVVGGHTNSECRLEKRGPTNVFCTGKLYPVLKTRGC